jgi:periplasmic divalent cation tolerance protein
MKTDYLLALTTCPDETNAAALAKSVVERGLAACVTRMPRGVSIYRWQGELQEAVEVVLLMKTRRDRFPALKAHLSAEHPYDVPELIAVPIAYGNDGYLRWIDECLAIPRDPG